MEALRNTSEAAFFIKEECKLIGIARATKRNSKAEGYIWVLKRKGSIKKWFINSFLDMLSILI